MDQYIEQHTNDISVFADFLAFPMHLHESIELVCVYTYDTWVHIGDQKYLLQKGDVACVFPFQPHGYSLDRMDYGQRNSLGLVVSHAMLGNMDTLLRRYLPTTPVVSAEKVHSEVYIAFEKIRKYIKEGESVQVIAAWTQLLFARLLPEFNLQPQKESKSDKVVQRALQWIANGYNQPLTLEKTAKALGISQSYLSHVLIAKSGKSFSELLNHTRIDKARRLLIDTELSVTEIAYEAGFTSIRSFNRNFFQLCNVSPREYRKQFHIV